MVHANSSFSLQGNAVEVRVIQNGTGTQGFNLTGNGSANLIVANDGDNTLKGGLGSDTLYGGGGDDVYFLRYVGFVKEAEGRGTDRVILFDTGTAGVFYSEYTLAKDSEIEYLEARTTYDFHLNGNEFANTIPGNGFVNKITEGTAMTFCTASAATIFSKAQAARTC